MVLKNKYKTSGNTLLTHTHYAPYVSDNLLLNGGSVDCNLHLYHLCCNRNPTYMT